MEYEELKLLKESEKSTTHLVREKNGERVFIRKVLNRQVSAYLELKNCQHPYLPRLYEVNLEEESTTVIEEYIEGQLLSSMELPEKQAIRAMKELCSALEFLHGKGIIHRDVKPSNIILAKDGHIRLIDFDAMRMPKEDVEQDTRLLGTRGYAPPEQYGFSQTDERADIYSLGITLRTLLKDKAKKPHYNWIIQKCTKLNPDDRYRTVKKVRAALAFREFRGYALGIFLIVLLFAIAGSWTAYRLQDQGEDAALGELVTLPAPENPHWNGETGIAVWGNVPESGDGHGEVSYKYRIYRKDTMTPPDLEKDDWDSEGDMRGNGLVDKTTSTCSLNMTFKLSKDGYYYFTVSAQGDGATYADSPYVVSDAFEFKGENAPMLPAPTGLQWKLLEMEDGREFYATWDNLDDYDDEDSFDVTVYDKDGNYVMNNIWSKTMIMKKGQGGIRVRKEFLADKHNKYRFAVEVHTSRPNEYKSFLLPDPAPEESFSPWYQW